MYETDELLYANNNFRDDAPAQRMITQQYITNRDVHHSVVNWEQQYETMLEVMKRQIHNLTIRKLYDYGRDIRTRNKKICKMNKDQQNAIFIYDFFQGIPRAIEFLQDVSIDNLNKLRNVDCTTIITTRQAIVANQSHVEQGLSNFETDDLWSIGDSNDAVGVLFTPQPPSREPSHSPQPPPAATTASQLFGCDITEFCDLLLPDCNGITCYARIY
jgi:hypothetical protein